MSSAAVSGADAVIIGGGVTGCGAAYHLALAGMSIVLLERGALNRGASGRNAGSLHFQLQHQTASFDERKRRKLAATVPMLKAAAGAWRRLSEAMDEDFELVQRGGLMVAETDAEVASLRAKHALEQAWQLNTELLDSRGAREAAPGISPRIQAATFCPYEGHANPRLVTLALARAAQRHGARLHTGSEVASIQSEDACYQVVTRNGLRFSTPRVVDAAGAWAGDVAALAGLPLPVQAVPLHMNVTERTGPLLALSLQHVGERLSLKQLRDGNVLIGGGWPAHRRRMDGVVPKNGPVDVLYESLARNVAVAVRVLPALSEVRLLRTWTGLAAWTPDGLPVLGEMRHRPDFYVACGGNGFTLGPLFAERLAERILAGARSHEWAVLDPARFLGRAPIEAPPP